MKLKLFLSLFLGLVFILISGVFRPVFFSWQFDGNKPTAYFNLPFTRSGTTFAVSWTGQDVGPGGNSTPSLFQVQYKMVDSSDSACSTGSYTNLEGDGNNTWSTKTSDNVTITSGHYLCLNIRAKDGAGNIGNWNDSTKVLVGGAWDQVLDNGDIHSVGAINFKHIPNGSYLSNGYGVITSNSTAVFGKDGLADPSYRAHNPSVPDWTIKNYSSTIAAGNFSHFYQLLGSPTATTFTGGSIGSSGIYYSAVSVNTASWSIGSNVKAVVLINGDLTISNNITVPVGSSVVFITNGNIVIDGSVNTLEGVYLAQGTFNTGNSSAALIARGSFTSFGGFILGRDLDVNNLTSAAEKFEARPDLLINMNQAIKEPFFTWQETTP